MNPEIKEPEGAAGTQICMYHQVNSCPFGITCKFPHNLDDVSAEPSTSGTAAEYSWANAPEFIPMDRRIDSNEVGKCFYDPNSIQKNGLCQICFELEINSMSPKDQRSHLIICGNLNPEKNDFSRSIVKSLNKQCTICFDVVFEKEIQSFWPLSKLPDDVKFGILPNCSHVFCLTCIRVWRQSTEFENNAVRGCPVCRISSDFVCPSTTWVETPDAKTKMITDYKNALSHKDCKYFRYGSGCCPFGNKCFYRHVASNGETIDLGQPQHRRPHYPNVQTVITEEMFRLLCDADYLLNLMRRFDPELYARRLVQYIDYRENASFLGQLNTSMREDIEVRVIPRMIVNFRVIQPLIEETLKFLE